MTDNPSMENLTGSEDIKAVVDAGLKLASEAIEHGQIDQAREVYEGLLGADPKNAEVLNGLGVVWSAREDLGKAEKFFKAASKAEPKVAIYHKNLGFVLTAQKRFPRAVRELETAVRLDPTDADAGYKLALAYGGRGNATAYEKQLRTVLLTDPAHYEANNDLGILLITHRVLDDAVKLLDVAVASPKAGPGTHANLANAYFLLGKNAEARASFAVAHDMEPENNDWIIGLAMSERNMGNLDAALDNVDSVLRSAPDNANAFNLRGTIVRELGRLDEAAIDFDNAIKLNPTLPAALVNRGLLYLLQGNWERGLGGFEQRLINPDLQPLRQDFGRPLWTGDDISGKTILVYAEQGFGDTIQNFRFCDNLVKQGAQVVAEVQPNLKSLLDGEIDGVTVVSPRDARPEIDCFAPIMSLLNLLRINGPDQVSSAPYLTSRAASPEMSKRLDVGGKLKVGINWAGSPGHKEDYKRSIDPSLLAPLADIPNVQFFNLHIGDAAEKPALFNEQSDLSDLVSDFSDTASLIAELDLVISVDTATVHLAGALGKSCWALIPFVPDWRWGLQGDETCWYDGITLFRQPSLGDWESVISTIASKLAELPDTNET